MAKSVVIIFATLPKRKRSAIVNAMRSSNMKATLVVVLLSTISQLVLGQRWKGAGNAQLDIQNAPQADAHTATQGAVDNARGAFGPVNARNAFGAESRGSHGQDAVDKARSFINTSRGGDYYYTSGKGKGKGSYEYYYPPTGSKGKGKGGKGGKGSDEYYYPPAGKGKGGEYYYPPAGKGKGGEYYYSSGKGTSSKKSSSKSKGE
jgi:hypothetical protein